MSTPGEPREACCHDREIGWLLDDLAVLGVYGGMIPESLIDALPPARALLHIRLALEGYARLERGTLDDLVNAVHLTVGHHDAAAPGWWTRYLTAQHLARPVQIPVVT